MKFNKIKDSKENVKKKKELKPSTNSTKIKKAKKKFYQAKKSVEPKIKTKVVMPKTKEDISANWIQVQTIIKEENKKIDDQAKLKNIKSKANKKKDKESNKKKDKESNKNLTLKEKFKLKRKLKRENAKLNKSKKINKKPQSTKKESDSKKNDNPNLWFEVDQIYLDKAVNPGLLFLNHYDLKVINFYLLLNLKVNRHSPSKMEI